MGRLSFLAVAIAAVVAPNRRKKPPLPEGEVGAVWNLRDELARVTIRKFAHLAEEQPGGGSQCDKVEHAAAVLTCGRDALITTERAMGGLIEPT